MCGPCDFSVTPSPLTGIWTLDLGLTIRTQACQTKFEIFLFKQIIYIVEVSLWQNLPYQKNTWHTIYLMRSFSMRGEQRTGRGPWTLTLPFSNISEAWHIQHTRGRERERERERAFWRGQELTGGSPSSFRSQGDQELGRGNVLSICSVQSRGSRP